MNKPETYELVETNDGDQEEQPLAPEPVSGESKLDDPGFRNSASEFLKATYYWVVSRL